MQNRSSAIVTQNPSHAFAKRDEGGQTKGDLKTDRYPGKEGLKMFGKRIGLPGRARRPVSL
jgi:hypothetical protein